MSQLLSSRNILSIEGMSPLTRGLLNSSYFADLQQVTTGEPHGKTIVNLFYETSTRTRTSFELAVKDLMDPYLTSRLRALLSKRRNTSGHFFT